MRSGDNRDPPNERWGRSKVFPDQDRHAADRRAGLVSEPRWRRYRNWGTPLRAYRLADSAYWCQTSHVNVVTRQGPWTFLTNHAHVLLCLAGTPDLRVRDIAERVGITERAVLRILHDLGETGYVERARVGRRTRYRLQLDRPMRHPVESRRPVRVLVELLADTWAEGGGSPLDGGASERRPKEAEQLGPYSSS